MKALGFNDVNEVGGPKSTSVNSGANLQICGKKQIIRTNTSKI